MGWVPRKEGILTLREAPLDYEECLQSAAAKWATVGGGTATAVMSAFDQETRTWTPIESC